jgi:hypothetical protein
MLFALAMSRSGVVTKGALIIVVVVVAYISARAEFVTTIGRNPHPHLEAGQFITKLMIC